MDVLAVTVWAIMCMYDWHCLLTRREDRHEPGVFNVGSGSPEPTELVAMLKRLAAGEPIKLLVPSGPGWWQTPEAQIYCLPESLLSTPAE
ncbi:hypothetical protein [Spirosoma pulveris]